MLYLLLFKKKKKQEKGETARGPFPRAYIP
jgi:hypothetical protein